MNRTEYLDDYGTQVDPLFDMVDELEAEIQRLGSIIMDRDIDIGLLLGKVDDLEEERDELIFDRDGRDFPQGELK